MKQTINIVKSIKVLPLYKSLSKEEEKPFKSDLEKPKPPRPISNNSPSFFYTS